MHQDLPAYLLNWKITITIHNHNTRSTTDICSFRTKHEFAKRFLIYNLPHVINNTPEMLQIKLELAVCEVFQIIPNKYLLQKCDDTCSITNSYTCYQNRLNHYTMDECTTTIYYNLYYICSHIFQYIHSDIYARHIFFR